MMVKEPRTLGEYCSLLQYLACVIDEEEADREREVPHQKAESEKVLVELAARLEEVLLSKEADRE